MTRKALINKIGLELHLLYLKKWIKIHYPLSKLIRICKGNICLFGEMYYYKKIVPDYNQFKLSNLVSN